MHIGQDVRNIRCKGIDSTISFLEIPLPKCSYDGNDSERTQRGNTVIRHYESCVGERKSLVGAIANRNLCVWSKLLQVINQLVHDRSAIANLSFVFFSVLAYVKWLGQNSDAFRVIWNPFFVFVEADHPKIIATNTTEDVSTSKMKRNIVQFDIMDERCCIDGDIGMPTNVVSGSHQRDRHLSQIVLDLKRHLIDAKKRIFRRTGLF
mmetsp:Transcript_8469/g.16380  ORF Transcript_8469/g.16380 Transcript_8469/m.16380 type:complete len:207 (-) Transcript_8469:254-874(-)